MSDVLNLEDASAPHAPHGQIVIGLVGQVCAGKSAVAEAFRQLGARVYDADKSVHEIYTRADVIAEVVALFGTEVLDKDGAIDRKKLGQLVFNDTALLKRLTRDIVYPRTGVEMMKSIDEFRNSDAPALLVDAPSLFESGRENLCDSIVFVSAPMERREEWARKRGWMRGEITRRESKLRPEAEKRQRADAVIENNGTLENLGQQVGRLMRLWTMQV